MSTRKHSSKDLASPSSMGMLAASSALRSSGRDGSATTDELIAFAHNTEECEALIRYAKNYAIRMQDYYHDFLNDHASLRSCGTPIGKKIKENTGPLKDDIKHIERHAKAIL